jgi:hypothetical protein
MESVIICAAKENCNNGKQFHPSCVGYVEELEMGGMFLTQFSIQ